MISFSQLPGEAGLKVIGREVIWGSFRTLFVEPVVMVKGRKATENRRGIYYHGAAGGSGQNG